MNNLELPAPELKIALAGFNKVISRGTSLPVLGCLRIQPTTNGVDLQVTDLDSFATYRINSETHAEFPPCLVSVAAVAEVAKSSKDRIELIYEGPQSLKLRHFIGAHPVEQPIESLPIEEWPTVPQIKVEPFLVEPGFKEGFRHALECASTESTRLILNGVCLDVAQPNCHCLIGTDGRHLFSANTFHFPFQESAVIPSRKFLVWSGFAEDGDWLLALDSPSEGTDPKGAYIQIQSDHWTFLMRCLEGQYPNWRQVMPSPDRKFTRVVLNDEAIDLVLDAVPRLPMRDDSGLSVTMILEAGKLRLASGNVAEIPIPGALITGPDQRVCLNPAFITKALRFGLTELEVQDSLSPVMFTAPGKKMLAMPMRLGDETISAAAPSQASPPSSQEATQRTETSEPATPSAGQQTNQTDQNTAMTANNITALPAPVRGGSKPTNGNGNNGETSTALKAVIDQVERIKTNLREVVSDLNDTVDLLRAAEREKKLALKEVESIRPTLRSLQRMQL